MSSYREAAKNIIDKYGRRSGFDRRVAQKDSFPFERRNAEERRKNRRDRRESLADRVWTP